MRQGIPEVDNPDADENAVRARGVLCGGLYSIEVDEPTSDAGAAARFARPDGTSVQVRASSVSVAVRSATESKGAMAFLIAHAAAASRAKRQQEELEQQRLQQEDGAEQGAATGAAAAGAAVIGAAAVGTATSGTTPQQPTPPPSPPASPSLPPEDDDGRGVAILAQMPAAEASGSAVARLLGEVIEGHLSPERAVTEIGEGNESLPSGADAVVPLADGELEQSADDCLKRAASEGCVEEELLLDSAPKALRPKSPWGSPRCFANTPPRREASPPRIEPHSEAPVVPIRPVECSQSISAHPTATFGADGTQSSSEAAAVGAMNRLHTATLVDLQAEEARRLQVTAHLCRAHLCRAHLCRAHLCRAHLCRCPPFPCTHHSTAPSPTPQALKRFIGKRNVRGLRLNTIESANTAMMYLEKTKEYLW